MKRIELMERGAWEWWSSHKDFIFGIIEENRETTPELYQEDDCGIIHLIEFDKYRQVRQALTTLEALLAENKRYREALKKIAVYDLYDCSAVEDVNFSEQSKLMYEIARQALNPSEEFDKVFEENFWDLLA